jgi:predicted nucleotidyltransferase
MKGIKEIRGIISSHMETLKGDYHVKNIGVFGSYVRNEAKGGSDIDILVEFSQPIGLIDFIRLEDYLQNLLGISVDLVAKDGIKPGLEDTIIDEVVYV